MANSARNRLFSSPPSIPGVASAYGWSADAVITGVNPVTGAWSPVSVDADGIVNVAIAGGISISGASISVDAVAVTGNPDMTVSNTAPIPISGVVVSSPSPIQAISGYVHTIVTGAVSASFDTAPLVLATASGNNNTLVADRLLSGISGQLGATLNVSVANTAPMPISGVVQASVSIGNVAVTGGSIQTITTGSFSATVDNSAVITAIGSGNALLVIANQLSSGISGLLASNLTDPAYVTGAVSVTNTAPLAFSGVTQANITNPLLATSGSATLTNVLLGVSGNTVNTVTGWNTGNLVTVQPRSTNTVSNSTPSGVAPWTVITDMRTGQIGANPNRVMFFVQNIHTGVPTYVALNNTAAGTGNFNFILNPSQNLGYGGSSFADDHYRGAVQISGGAYIAWEL